MGKIVKSNLPCLNPECGSSDARQEYEGGTSFCFSCHTWFGRDKTGTKGIKINKVVSQNKLPSIVEIDDYVTRGFKERKITKVVNEFYKVKISYNEDGEIDAHYYPYGEHAYKYRHLPKKFAWIGSKPKDLFGRELFSGGGRKLIICEGEIDTLSIAQAVYDRYQKFYPVVGISSSSDLKPLLEQRDWIRSFQEVLLCFDEDQAGYDSINKATKIVGLDKVKIVKLPENDANDVLVNHSSERLLQCTFNAEKYIPKGILTKDELWERIENLSKIKSIPYPPCLEGINSKLKGMRFGEIALFISGTGSGKSTILREIMIHILSNTPDKIGIVSLEESPEETSIKLSGMILYENPSHKEIPLDQLKAGFDVIFNDDRTLILDHQDLRSEETILDKIEYMCLAGYKYIFIDHITILVADGVDGTDGLEAQDKVMGQLLRLVKRYDVWVGLISHLRKVQTGGKSFEEGRLPTLDDIRGSGSVKQISMDIIAFARNMVAEDPLERNTIKMSVLKARFTGLTGPVEGAYYELETGRLKHVNDAPQEEFVAIS